MSATAQDVIEGRASWSVDVSDCLDWLRTLPGDCAHCCITSPPYYGLRAYLPKDHPDREKEVGREPTPQEYVSRLVEVFGQVRRVLRPDGVLLLNIGDCYAGGGRGGHAFKAGGGRWGKPVPPQGEGNAYPTSLVPPGLKPKDLIGVPWMLAFALRESGWYLRSECIWEKPNAMPESVTDRPTKAHEHVFILTRSGRYFWDGEAIKVNTASIGGSARVFGALAQEGTQRKDQGNTFVDNGSANLRSVWSIPVGNCKEAHFAVMPTALASLCVRAATSAHDCCPACGTPWVRVTRKERKPTRPGTESKVKKAREDWHECPKDAARREQGLQSDRSGLHNQYVVGNRDPQRHCTTTETLSWRQGCKCPPADPVGCVVLDPFAGSGTTGLVARGLNRRFIGCDLSEKYAAIARRRIGGANALFDQRTPSLVSEPPSLFDALPGETNP